MKILLIMPHYGAYRGLIARFTYPCLTLQQIAGCTPKEHIVEIVDERYSNIPFHKNYDLIGISCLTYNSFRGYEIADEFRRRGITVVIGGQHASALPDEAKQHADSVVIGEAELTWPQLLKDFENSQLKPYYKADRLVKPELIPPARHDIGIYTSMEAIQATRGCTIGCEFCAMQNIEGPIFRKRPLFNIIDEMKKIKAKTIFFPDASLTIDPNYTKALFKEIGTLNKNFHCFGNINILYRDDELLKIASDAGVKRWYIGIESISQENIIAIGKRTNQVEEYEKALNKINDYGMKITAFFIFGFDNDTVDIIYKTIKLINEWNIDTVSFSIITPYPGTRLFNRLENEGRITSYDWSRYTEGRVNFKPKKMSEEELFFNVKKAVLNFYSIKNSFKNSLKISNYNPVQSTKKFLNKMLLRSYLRALLL